MPQMGDLGSKVLPPVLQGEVANWTVGSTPRSSLSINSTMNVFRVAWGMRFNHGGGYQYRLCPLEKMPCTEEQFQEMPLQFVRDEQAIVSLGILERVYSFDFSRCGTTGLSTPSEACLSMTQCVQWCQRDQLGLATRFLESTPTTSGWPSSAGAGVKMGHLERLGEGTSGSQKPKLQAYVNCFRCADRQELLGVLTKKTAQTSRRPVPTLTRAGKKIFL